MNENEALKVHYNQLVGYKITEVIILEDDEDTDDFGGEPRVVLVMTKGKKELVVEVLSDPAGNDVGFLDIAEMKK